MTAPIPLAALCLLLAGSVYAENRVVTHHGPDGKPVRVMVQEQSCAHWASTGIRHLGGYTDRANRRIFLCGRLEDEAHELAHIAGMEHGWFIRNGSSQCAPVLQAGWNTGYRVGQRICMSAVLPRGEWLE